MDKFYSNSFDNSVKSAFEKADNELKSSGNWDAMHQVLDREMPVDKKKRRFFFWFVIVGLLVGTVFGYQNWETNKEDKKAAIKVEEKSIQVENNTLRSIETQTSESNLGSSETNHSGKISGSNEKPNSIVTEKLNHLKNGIHKTISNNKQSVDTLYILEKENTVTNNDKNVANKENDTLVTSLPIDSVPPTSITPQLKKPSTRQQTRWEWNLSFAPDFLLANLQPFYRPGVSIGMGINYQLSPNWAIRTGLLYNYTPVYESGQTYLYKPSPNLPAYNTLELKQVKGSLHIFEVPLAVRYTAKPSNKISFLGSVGLSSLFFLKQKLTYDLLLNGNTPLLWNSENDSDDFGESHILSNLVVGTGISIKTKRSAVIEIEPVFKLPLEELGEGHNRLGTIAIYLHLKQPIFKQKK
ncbi:porin family protein [Sediminibacterium sp. TEGAF015]|uniref:porin family protein n=1 Tax=Sediminibacterium sp. TEGAF015 TaxID=575378 RepID=UPI002206704C|nr:porin family protein [Sediminibacterium sp. TEGAF015]BDQ12663.1 hypothetical protein TEGAF0_18800 [Sediminibacterium sp. TEGAF015]